MCIAIVKPAGKWVSEAELFNSFQANPHGAGYAYYDATAKSVVVKKGYFTFEEFKTEYMQDITIDTLAFAHFRISTAGKKNTANCHPFLIDSGALMHNGPCLNRDRCKGDEERSDTWQFAEDMMKALSIKNIRAIQPMIEDFIGYEKIAYMFTDGTYMIANEKNGQWSEGCWFSNGSFRSYVQDKGKAFRGSNSEYAGRDYSSPYYTANRAQSASNATKAGKGTKTFPGEAFRSIGVKPGLFRCVWSFALTAFVPRDVQIDQYHLQWMEKFCAFVPADVVGELSWDKVHVYEATPKAMAKAGGPHYKVDEDWAIVADCLKNEAEVRLFLNDATPWYSEEEIKANAEKAAKLAKTAEEKTAGKPVALAAEKSPDAVPTEQAGATVH